MYKIIPITDLRNTTEISKLCNKEDKPIFITKNGYSDLVIMSLKAYELLEGTKTQLEPFHEWNTLKREYLPQD